MTSKRLAPALLFGLLAFVALTVGVALHPEGAAATPPALAQVTPVAPPAPAPGVPAPAARGAAAPAPPAVATPAPAPSAPASSTPAASAAPAPVAPVPAVDPNMATIVIGTMPPATATVHWGRKLLGKITPGKPLVVVRPRDSGPLDVMVRATGFLAVQTRAHTFSDNRVVVKLTPPENASELLGYRAPVDAGVPTPEQAAALDAIAGDTGVTAPSPLLPDAPFQVVPTTPAPMLPLAPEP